MFWTFGIAISSKRFRIPVKWFDTIYTKRTTASRSPAFCFQSRNSQHVYLCRSADGYVANFLRFDKSLQMWQRMRIVHNFKFTGFVFFICMQESCCLGPCFFKIIFAPFVEIGVWYTFVRSLLILERISNITRHKCSELSALQYHRSDSGYQ